MISTKCKKEKLSSDHYPVMQFSDCYGTTNNEIIHKIAVYQDSIIILQSANSITSNCQFLQVHISLLNNLTLK